MDNGLVAKRMFIAWATLALTLVVYVLPNMTLADSTDPKRFFLAGPGPVYDTIEATGSRPGHYRWLGEDEHDKAGASVAGIGDFNGDGYRDMAVGAPRANYIPGSGSSRSHNGRAYIIFGGPASQLASGNLGTLASSKKGMVIYGAASEDNFGREVAKAGDVNGDGLADVIISAPSADPAGLENAGTVYVILGRRTSSLTASQHKIDLGAGLSRTSGFPVRGGTRGGYLGSAIAGVGDVDRDWRSDIMISEVGEAYLLTKALLKGWQSSGYVDIGTPFRSGEGLRIYGDDALGESVDSAGDQNHDGLLDFAIGNDNTELGRPESLHNMAYVIYGRRNLPTAVNVTSLDPDVNGFSIKNTTANTGRVGATYTVRYGGYLNDPRSDSQRYADLLIADGDRSYCLNTSDSTGESESPPEVGDDTSDGGSGEEGDEPETGPESGLGPVNCDSAPVGGEEIEHVRVGEAYALFGSDDNVNIEEMGHGGATIANTRALALYYSGMGTPPGMLGAAIASADVNGDGNSEILTSDPYVSSFGRSSNGAVYIISAPATEGNAFSGGELALDPSGSGAFKVIAGPISGSSSGWALSSAGDVNGDTREDFIIGSPEFDKDGTHARDDRGRVDLVLGSGPPELNYADELKIKSGQGVTFGPAAIRRTGAYIFEVEPALPSGLRLNQANGDITGMVPDGTTLENKTYKVTLKDQSGLPPAEDQFQLSSVLPAETVTPIEPVEMQPQPVVETPCLDPSYPGNSYFGPVDPSCPTDTRAVSASLTVKLRGSRRLSRIRRTRGVKVRVSANVPLAVSLNAHAGLRLRRRNKTVKLGRRKVTLSEGKLMRNATVRLSRSAARRLRGARRVAVVVTAKATFNGLPVYAQTLAIFRK